MRIALYLTFIIATCSMPSCGNVSAGGSVSPMEVVLSPGQAFKVQLESGQNVEVLYSGERQRLIKIGPTEYTLSVLVRERRFAPSHHIGQGILGVYNPANTRDIGSSYNHDRRIIYLECERHLSNNDELKDLLWRGSANYSRYLADDGYVMSVGSFRDDTSLNITIWRIYIGDRPIAPSDVGKGAYGELIISTGVGSHQGT